MVASGKINRENVWECYHQNEAELVCGEESFKMVPCRKDCGEIFCSEECERNMWSCGGHDLLCTGFIPEPQSAVDEKEKDESLEQGDVDVNGDVNGDGNEEKKVINNDKVEDETDLHNVLLHPLLQFKVHAVQNNEIFIMVGDIVATVVSLRRQQIEYNQKNNDARHVNEVTLEELMAPYLDFTLVPWWEVATAPLISDPMKMVECIDLNRTLRELCSTSASLLKDAFSCIEGDEVFQQTLSQAIEECQDKYEMFSEEFFGKVIGSFEQNAMGIRARHPLCRDVLEDYDLRVRRHDALVKCIEIAGMIGAGEEEEMEEGDGEDAINVEDKGNEYSVDDISAFIAGLHIDEEGLTTTTKPNGGADEDGTMEEEEEEPTGGDDLDTMFTPLDGTSMYYTACKMNHSCEPNVVARYNYSCSGGGKLARWGKNFPLVVQCVALRDIEEGEELCISYIKSDAELNERQEILSNYGFQCECAKCVREKNLSESNAQDANAQVIEFDDDEDDVFAADADDESDEDGDGGSNSEENNDGAQLLIERLKELDRSTAASTLGRVPISILAPAVSFVNQLGFQILQDLESASEETNENVVSVKKLLKGVLNWLGERDITSLHRTASEGERRTLSILHKSGGWPSVALREAHGCFCVVSAICFAHHGNFLPATQMLDKASTFGLPRDRIGNFVQYVESHTTSISSSHNTRFLVPRSVV